MRFPRTVVATTSRISAGATTGASLASPISRSSAGLRSDGARSARDLADLRFVELRGQIRVDERQLFLLFLHQVVSSALAERVDGVAPHLRLLREHFLDRRVVEHAGFVLAEPRLARGLVLAFCG